VRIISSDGSALDVDATDRTGILVFRARLALFLVAGFLTPRGFFELEFRDDAEAVRPEFFSVSVVFVFLGTG
jgi:hypothetical protein